jgi:rhodanese-related sulfurtransferase
VRQSHPLLEEVDAPALAAALAGDDPPLLVDVRTDPERAVAVIEPSLHIGLDRFVERASAEIPGTATWSCTATSGRAAPRRRCG